MTALRVVELHSELEGVPSGSFTHEQINTILSGSAFVLASGSTGDLSGSRLLVAGPGITINDNGPGSTLIISASAATTTIEWNETPSGSIDNSNRDFTLSFTPSDPDKLMFFLNGQLQARGTDGDFTLSGSTVTFNKPHLPRTRDVLRATYERSK